MSDIKIGLPGGADYLQPELTVSQGTVASGAGSISVASNIATVTTAGVHGLTMTPAAGTMPNYFVQLSGVTAQSGIGTLNGPIFRLLAIPSTTTFQIYTTVTAGTFTAGTVAPVFLAPFTGIVGSTFVGFLNNLGSNVVPALVQSSFVQFSLGTNVNIQYNADNTSIVQDSTTGNTLGAAPVYRISNAVSTGGQQWFNPPQMIAVCVAAANTSRFSVIE